MTIHDLPFWAPMFDIVWLHAAGGGRGALCDIADCVARACLDDANVLRYTQRGECDKLTL
jgi:hypothetical protein